MWLNDQCFHLGFEGVRKELWVTLQGNTHTITDRRRVTVRLKVNLINGNLASTGIWTTKIRNSTLPGLILVE